MTYARDTICFSWCSEGPFADEDACAQTSFGGRVQSQEDSFSDVDTVANAIALRWIDIREQHPQEARVFLTHPVCNFGIYYNSTMIDGDSLATFGCVKLLTTVNVKSTTVSRSFFWYQRTDAGKATTWENMKIQLRKAHLEK